MFALRTDKVVPIPVDETGLVLDDRLSDCRLVFVTPSHQYPTTATMPIAQRKELLARAKADDFVILEDDYEFETNYVSDPCPALKSLDKEGRVIYIGSLSNPWCQGSGLASWSHPGP